MYYSLFQLFLFLRSARANPNVRQIPGVARADVTATLVVVTPILCTVTTEAIVYQVWRTLFIFIHNHLCNLLLFVFFLFNLRCQSAVYRVCSLFKSWCRNLQKMYKVYKLKYKGVHLRIFENITFTSEVATWESFIYKWRSIDCIYICNIIPMIKGKKILII